MSFLSASTPLKLGFLSVLEEPGGYLGGYLVMNAWGRPLEFRVSNPIQPSRVQQILYGDTLRPYIFADVIGKTLVEKTATSVQVIVTDCRPALDLRRSIQIPMVWLDVVNNRQDVSPPHDSAELETPRTSPVNRDIHCHPEFAEDKPTISKLLERLPDSLDLAEPFARIREAIGETRKIGVISRAS